MFPPGWLVYHTVLLLLLLGLPVKMVGMPQVVLLPAVKAFC
jgi:hypothetical protein